MNIDMASKFSFHPNINDDELEQYDIDRNIYLELELCKYFNPECKF